MALKFTNNIDTGNYAPSVKYGTVVRTPSVGNIELPDASSSFNIDLSNVANAIADRTESEERMKLAELDAQLKIAAQKEKDNENNLKELQRIEGLNYGREIEGLQLALKQGMPLTEYQVNLKAINDKYASRGIIDTSTMTSVGNAYGYIGKSLLEKEAIYEQERANKSREASIAAISAYSPNFATLSPYQQNAIIDAVNYYKEDYKSIEQTMSSKVFTEEGRNKLRERQKSNVYGMVSITYNEALNNLIASKGVSNVTPTDIFNIRYQISSQVKNAIPSMDKNVLETVLTDVQNESLPQAMIQQSYRADEETLNVLKTAKDKQEVETVLELNNYLPHLRIISAMPSEVREAYLVDENNRSMLSGGINAYAGGFKNKKVTEGEVLYDRGTDTSYIVKSTDVTTYDVGYGWTMQNLKGLAEKTVKNRNNSKYTSKARKEDYINLVDGLVYNPDGFNEDDVRTTINNMKADPLVSKEEAIQNIARKGNGAILMKRQIGNQGTINKLVRNANKLKYEYGDRIRIRKDGTITFIDGKGFWEELGETGEGLEVKNNVIEINDTLMKISPDPYTRAGAATYLFNMEFTPLAKGEEDYLEQIHPLDTAAGYLTKGLATVSKTAIALDDATSPDIYYTKVEKPTMKEGTIAFQRTPEELGVDLQGIAEAQGYNGTIDLNKRKGGIYDTKDGTFKTLQSESVTLDDGQVLLYPLVDTDRGVIMSSQQAQFKAKNSDEQHLGIYKNKEEADRVAKMLSKESDKIYRIAVKNLESQINKDKTAYVAKKNTPYKDAEGILTIPISDDNTLEIRNYNGDDYSNITDVNNLYIDTVDAGFIILERGDSQHSYGIYPTKEDAEQALKITKELVKLNE